LLSQKEMGMDPKINESKAVESLRQIVAELSNEKLGQYKKAAGDQATAADKAGDYAKGHKRFKGIVKATNKQFDNDAKKHREQGMAEAGSNAIDTVSKRLTDPKDGMTAKLRAAGDKKRDSQYMGTQIAKNDRTSKDEWGNLKEKIKGADGKACWKGYKYAGTKNGKDKCVPIGEAYELEMTLAILKLFESNK
jgi:hypothetical protein